MSRVVISAIGIDRPGIVAAVSGVLFEQMVNIEDTTMTKLGNQFAMIIIVALHDGLALKELDASFERVRAQFGLHLTVDELEEAKEAACDGTPQVCMVSVLGADKPGIVHKVTSAISQKGLNITDVSSKRLESTGKPVYAMILEVSLNTEDEMGDLRSKLKELARKMDADISVRLVESATL